MGLGLVQPQRRHATRAEDGDADKAIAAYIKAASYPDAPVETWKALGDIYQSQGQLDSARDAFESYLSKSPDAEDRELVKYILENLGT